MDDPGRVRLRTVFDRAADDYQRTRPVCPPRLFDDLIGPQHFPPEGGSFFAEVASRRYPFQLPYSARDYLAILATQCSTHALGEARRADFLARVGHRLESLGWPRLTATFVAYLTVGRRI